MKKTIYLYSGEGTNNPQTSYKLIKLSKRWPEIKSILESELNLDLEKIWMQEIGKHNCPYSPLLTVISQICLSDIWSRWGYSPDVVVGHSIGELSAAYEAGMYSLEHILLLTYQIGKIASKLNGAMLHGEFSDREIEQMPLNISSFNFKRNGKKHLTLSGYADELAEFKDQHPELVFLKIPHPWHHPDYGAFMEDISFPPSNNAGNFKFVSGLSADFESQLKSEYWKQWLTTPIDFIGSMRAIKEHYDDHHLDIIEIGFHPVLVECCKIFQNYRYASSMFRGEDEFKWILHQRKLLDQNKFLEKLKSSIEKFHPQLEFGTALAYQGFTSLKFAEFSEYLEIFFPSLAPQDFYRYKTINQLIDKFGSEGPLAVSTNNKLHRNEVVIAGMSCRFPSSIEKVNQFWDSLMHHEDQVHANSGRGDFEAGFLNDDISKFDHSYFNISEAEARTMDPQQILALELTELLWQDTGIDPLELDRKKVGVYIGAWNQEYAGDEGSVYYPTGTNPSIIAARISYHYDLRGPSWVSNTACSSSMVAIHYASKDIEAGRVDYAIAGGVNMILGNHFTERMRNSGFLSKENRCRVFDDSANGYARAEGGGLVLLANKNLIKKYYAKLLGSAINQNGGRSQIISAPHPEAQEELIIDACRDADIKPQDISYVECHGTGTKIGDPIEISALQKTIAKDRSTPCYLGSVKSNIGHLESAAGIAGLIKSILILHYGVIPPNLHFKKPNQYIDFDSYRLKVVADATEINKQAKIGISSFGFGGSNAHLIVQGVENSVRKKVDDTEIPFDRSRSTPLSDFYKIDDINLDSQNYDAKIQNTDMESADVTGEGETATHDENKISRDEIQNLIWGIFYKVTNIETIESDIELTEQGLDSMSTAEFITQIETSLELELDPDFIFEYPLPDQLVDEIYALVQ